MINAKVRNKKMTNIHERLFESSSESFTASLTGVPSNLIHAHKKSIEDISLHCSYACMEVYTRHLARPELLALAMELVGLSYNDFDVLPDSVLREIIVDSQTLDFSL